MNNRKSIREEIEIKEERLLAPYSSKSKNAKREFIEKDDPYRTSFQRDRDRIIYSSAFRRLQYKTQVFLIEEADFYRTRLTHTIEVMQHSRTLARALNVNEDLVEAISLAHDLGHPPFGHAGEAILNELMSDHGGFDHNLQSLRIVEELEKRYVEFEGLNLTWEVREGLARHTTLYDKFNPPKEFTKYLQPSIEAQVVSVADELAYLAHDLDDGLRVGLVTEEILNNSRSSLWEKIFKKAKEEVSLKDRELLYRRAIRHLIEYSNIQVIEETLKRVGEENIRNLEDIRKLSYPLVNFCLEERKNFEDLKNIIHKEVYEHPDVLMMVEKGKEIIKNLFCKFEKNPKLLPKEIQEKIKKKEDKFRLICNYISGMTDRYAMDMYEMFFQPRMKILSRIGRR